MKNRTRYSDFDDDDKILKDGQRLRVHMMMADSRLSPLQRAVAASTQDIKPAFTDGRSTDATALNRPGFRVPVVNDRRAVHDAYEAYETDLVNAWRTDAQPRGQSSESGFGSKGPIGQQVGDRCTKDGWSGTLRRGSDGELFCDIGRKDGPGRDSITLDQHRQNMDRLYAERDEELRNAWRNNR